MIIKKYVIDVMKCYVLSNAYPMKIKTCCCLCFQIHLCFVEHLDKNCLLKAIETLIQVFHHTHVLNVPL